MRVYNCEVKKGGFFSSDYLIFQVDTNPVKWGVQRKDSDFYTLRKIMTRQFPHILIPPLPIKLNKWTSKALKKREKHFSRFMAAISRSEELKSSFFL